MVDLKTIIDKLNTLADPINAESYDNVGLIIGDYDSKINKILVALDVLPEVVEYALKNGVNLIISHHPIIFNPIKHINSDDIYFKSIRDAIKNNINLFCVHTNFDKCPISNSHYIVKSLNADYISFTEDGFGCVGKYDTPIDIKNFNNNVKKVIKDDNMRFYINNKEISTFCTIAGAGGRDEDFFLQNANNYDIIITSEIKHSIILISKIKKFSLIECGHRESEIFFEKIIKDYLKNSGILNTTDIIIYDKE